MINTLLAEYTLTKKEKYAKLKKLKKTYIKGKRGVKLYYDKFAS